MTTRLLQALEPWAKWARGRAVFGVRAETPESITNELLAAYEAEPDNEPRFRVGDRVRVRNVPRLVGVVVAEASMIQFRDSDDTGMWANLGLEHATPEPKPNYRLDRIEERLKKLEERDEHYPNKGAK